MAGMERTWSKGPARGYKWPDATPGNVIALKHGARSPRMYEPLAAEMFEEVMAARPDWQGYEETVAAACRFKARAALLDAWLAEHGMFDDRGRPRESAMKWWSQLESKAAALFASLGADPTSEARLARDRATATAVAFDLEAVREAGRAAIEARGRVIEPGGGQA